MAIGSDLLLCGPLFQLSQILDNEHKVGALIFPFREIKELIYAYATPICPWQSHFLPSPMYDFGPYMAP